MISCSRTGLTLRSTFITDWIHLFVVVQFSHVKLVNQAVHLANHNVLPVKVQLTIVLIVPVSELQPHNVHAQITLLYK
jgi:hypothetical protein